MNNAAKLDAAFAAALNIDESDVNDELAFEATPTWDSIGHMIVISTLEETFGIEIAPDDILNLRSYKDCKDMLAKRYGIIF